MNRLSLTDVQWQSIVAAWDQNPTRRPVLSSGGEPMIYSWRPAIEAVDGTSHQLDLDAEEAFHALWWLSNLKLMYRNKDASFRGVIMVFSFIVRLGSIPIRRHEDTLLRSIHDRLPVKHTPADYDSPYFKIFLLLQAHFSWLPLTQELATDLAIVLERVFSLFSMCAHRDWSSFDAYFNIWLFRIIGLIRMCVHGMWQDDPELKQIPHFDNDVSQSIKRQGLWLIHPSGHQPFRYSRHRVRA
jgi:hypothetical protein